MSRPYRSPGASAAPREPGPGRRLLDAAADRPGAGAQETDEGYGAAMLAPGPSGDAAASDAGEMLRARRSRSRSPAAGSPGCSRRAAPPGADITAWLRERGAAAARGEFVAAFTGVLTTARKV